MTKEQLKEEAKKEFDEKFYDIENYCSRDSFINFINSLIDKAYEEVRKEMKSEIMKIELCPTGNEIQQISELENKIQAFGYGQGWVLRKIENLN